MTEHVSTVILNARTPESAIPIRSDEAVIRTTDRNVFRSCRRQWSFSSHLKRNLGFKGPSPAPLWMGSGIHYALEDYYADNLYGTPAKSFLAYIAATKTFAQDKLPDNWEELMELGVAMMDYYITWLGPRDLRPTYILNGESQCEVNIKIEIPKEMIPNNHLIPYNKVFYSFQLDRVSYDAEANGLWIEEYKTAKLMQTNHLANDPQVSAYCWAAAQVYDLPILGVCYQQHLKGIPTEGRMLKNGEVSAAKQQSTTRALYREKLIEVYGSVDKAPMKNIETLNHMATQESANHDRYVRRDFVYRNDHMIKSEAHKILQEASDILNPELFLYPNPTRMGCQMCNVRSICLSMDDGSDWEYEAAQTLEPRVASYDEWREFLPDPKTFTGIKVI